MRTTKDIKTEKRNRRHARIRSTISGTKEVPRLAVFRSNKYIYAQIIDDKEGKTLSSASSMKMDKPSSLESAKKVGAALAENAKGLKISKIVFDRGGYIYTGKVKALAEGARESGLIF